VINLLPNNSAQTAGAIKHIAIYGLMGLTDAGASVAESFYKDGTSYTGFVLSYSLLISATSRIKTQTKGKCVTTDQIGLRSDGLYMESDFDYWNDTTTAWTSLGTLTFPFAQNVTIIIKRIL